jgi:hypothetical protein
LLRALIRKFWPSYYTLVPGGERKLAYNWANFEAAPSPSFASAADAVITKFWVKHTSRVSFIVYDPTVLTHTSHNFLYASLQAHYRVEEEDRAMVNGVLLRACRRLTWQQWYNHKHTCIAHYMAEQVKRVKKHDNIVEPPEMTLDAYRSVSTLPMRFYVVAKLQLHYLFFK